MQEVESWIALIVEKVNQYEFDEVKNSIYKGIDLFEKLAKILTENDVEEYNDILASIMTSIQKQDYLLLADLLEYKLLIFIKKIEKNNQKL